MDERKNETTDERRISLKGCLETVSALLGFFIGLVAFINAILKWVGNPRESRVAAIAGFITYLLVTLWFTFIKAKDKPKWQAASLIIFYIFTVPFFIWVGTWAFISSPPTPISPATSNLVQYFDFETSAAGWEDIVRLDAHWENPQTIEDAAMLPSNQRERGVAYVLELNAGGWLNYIVQHADPVRADVIVAHFYLPDTLDIEAKWVGIAAVDGTGGPWLAGSGDSIPLGRWTKIVLDLRGKYDSNDVPLNARPLFIQVAYLIKGRSTLQSDTVLVRLDDVAWYKAAGVQAIREQRGAGRTLFDFEKESIEGWQIDSGRVQTDTIMLSSERAYRGKWALKLETQLEGGGDNSTLRTKWLGSPPQGGWIAQVYLSDGVSAGTTVWANLFTYSKSGWQGSNAHSLVGGMWNTLVWDTHVVDWSTKKDITIGIQIGAEGGSYQGPIYVDDIQLFEN